MDKIGKNSDRVKAAILNIKRFREIKDLTREQMASDLNLSLSGYAKLERGEIEITVNRLFEIADILEVDVSQILNFDAKYIFNISNSQGVQGFDKGGNYHFHTQDIYREKYIAKLEEEIQNLKK
jgi:transcriptional regulator with XRE-family HTH domain